MPQTTPHKLREAEYSLSWIGTGEVDRHRRGCLNTSRTLADPTLILAGIGH